MVHGLLDESTDFGVLTAAQRAEGLQTRNLLGEADATRAVNATRHVGRHERADVLVLHHALLVVVARDVTAEAHRQVLQFALAALVADGAVERVIDKQELHRRFLRANGARRLREDLHAFHHGGGTSR